MTTQRKQRARHNRDGGQFLALPHVVMKSEAFKSLTGHQIKLLLDVAMQLGTNNNGRLTASWKYLSEERGWTSRDTMTKSIKVLLDRGLLFRTRIGHMPNKAAWFAVTWTPLHHHKDMDCGEQALPRGAYAHWSPLVKN